jgi:hypothetical protein
MSSFGRVPLGDVWEMLDVCAPGHKRVERTHHWCLYYKAQTYPTLPKGEHGPRKNPEIQVGHIRRMVRMFGIQDCAQKLIEALR